MPSQVRGGLEETDREKDYAEVPMLQDAVDSPDEVRRGSLAPDQPVRQQDQPTRRLKLGADADLVEEARERDASRQESIPYESRNHRPIRKSWKPVLPPNSANKTYMRSEEH